MEVQDHLCSTCYIVQLTTHIQLIQNKSLRQEEGSNNFVVNVLCISPMREGKWESSHLSQINEGSFERTT